MAWGVADIPDLSGRRALITGANSGLGFETASTLAARGARVILACRSMDKAEQAAATIRVHLPSAQIEPAELDLSSLASIRIFAKRMSEYHDRIDLLVNNAGVMATPFQKTLDQFELQFGTNHLGHFALTGLLIDLLNAAKGARVVTVSSVAHRSGHIDFENINAEKSYERMGAYAQSKLANVLFAYELDRRLKARGSATLSLAAHPGVSKSNLVQHSRFLQFTMNILAQETSKGAMPTLRACVDRDVVGGEFFGPRDFGRYRGPPTMQRSSRRSYDEETAGRLWRLSEDMTGVHYF